MVAAATGAARPPPLLPSVAQWKTGSTLVYASNVKFAIADPEFKHRKLSCAGAIRACYESSFAIINNSDRRLSNSLVMRCSTTSGNNEAEIELDEKKLNKGHPNSVGVESLLTTICDTTSIAEFKMDLAGFQLYVKRDLVQENVPSVIPNNPSVQPSIANQIPDSNGSPATTSLAISTTKTSNDGIQRIVDTASDVGLVILQSPKVGFFRRSRTIKGKRAPPSCKEKQEVKEGQVICYVEQLGGEIPIESDVSGEVIKILRADGEPVGYGDALISILPSFPGIKKLQ